MKRSAPSKRVRVPQKRGQQTKENLVMAGIQALTETNIYGLRISHVAKIAGVPQPLFDYHFQNGLDDLLMAMVLYQLGKLKGLAVVAIEKHALQPRKALEAYIRAHFDLYEADAGFRSVWSSYYHLIQNSRAFADLNRAVREGGHDRIVMLVQSIVTHERRVIPKPGESTAQVARAIQALITGCGFMASSETGGNYRQMADVCVTSANDILDHNFQLAK